MSGAVGKVGRCSPGIYRSLLYSIACIISGACSTGIACKISCRDNTVPGADVATAMRYDMIASISQVRVC